MNLKLLTPLFMCLMVVIVLFTTDTKVSFASTGDADKALNQSTSTLKSEMDKTLSSPKSDVSGMKTIKAGKGQFYNAYKSDFNKWQKDTEKQCGTGCADSSIKLLKNFDYVRGTFSCSWTDVVCHATNIVYGMSSSVINWTMTPLTSVVLKPSDILNDSVLTGYKTAFNAITKSLLLLFFIYQIFKLIAIRITDIQSATQEGNEKIITFVIASFMVFLYDALFKGIMNIQYLVNYPLLHGLASSKSIGKNIILDQMFTGNITLAGIFLIVIAVLIMILILQMFYSIALVSVLYVTGPVAITTMLNSEYNFFSVWLRVLISRLLTMGLQALSIVLGIRKLAQLTFDPSQTVTNTLTGIAFFIVGITIPSLLGQFGNSSGSGRAVMGSVKSITRMAILRR